MVHTPQAEMTRVPENTSKASGPTEVVLYEISDTKEHAPVRGTKSGWDKPSEGRRSSVDCCGILNIRARAKAMSNIPMCRERNDSRGVITTLRSIAPVSAMNRRN